MQNYNGQPQQAPQQQPQYQQYPGYPYPQQPKSSGGAFALLGFIFSAAGLLFELVGAIVYGAAGSSGAYVAAGILLILGFVLAGVGVTFSALALRKEKGKKLFAQLGFYMGLVGVAAGLASLANAIHGFRINSLYSLF